MVDENEKQKLILSEDKKQEREAAIRAKEDALDSYTRQYIEAMPVRCEFGWQGGEPTLTGLDFFKKMIEFQHKYKKPGQQIDIFSESSII